MSDNNGPAFPRPMPGAQYKAEELGLTKREYFAVHAPHPPGFWVPHWIEAHGGRAVPVDHATEMASWAKTYADALLAALGEDDQ